MTRTLACIAAITFLIALSTLPVMGQGPQQPIYTVVDLGTLGGNCSFAFGINNKGDVIGFSNFSNPPGETCIPVPGSVHAFIWQNGVMNDLGSFGGPNSEATFGPNERLQVVGLSEISAPDPNGEDFCGLGTHLTCLPFLWQGGAMTQLPTLGGNNGQASVINNRGQVVGFAENTTPDPDCPAPQVHQFKPVTWEKGQIRQLPTFPGDTDGVAFGSNDRDQVVGTSGKCASFNMDFGIYLQPLHALLWQNGKVTDLGNLGGADNNLAFGIDNQEHVVGVSGVSGDTNHHAFLWQNRVMIDLGTLPGDADSGALGVSGERVVGGSFPTSGLPRAFLWQNGVMTDLNTLISPPSSLFLLQANAINSRGEIAGFGLQTDTGDIHAFLALPNENAPQATGPLGGTPKGPVPEKLPTLLQEHFGLFGSRARVHNERN